MPDPRATEPTTLRVPTSTLDALGREARRKQRTRHWFIVQALIRLAAKIEAREQRKENKK